MKTQPSTFSRLAAWFKKNTEGTFLTQWISYFMIFSVLVIFILGYPAEEKLDWRFYDTVLSLGLVLVINILFFQSHEQPFFQRHEPFFHWTFNIVTNLLVLGAFALTARAEVVFLLLLQAAQFAGMFGVWPGGAIYCVVSLGIALGILKAYGESTVGLTQVASQFSAGLIFILIFTHLSDRSYQQTRRAESLLMDLQAANIELKAAQQKEKELAIAEERMRLARDIHDGLGHHLTVLSVQLQAADKLVERNPQAAAEAIRLSRAEAQAALEEVRRSVGVMRQLPAESQPLEEMLKNLVHDFDQHTGLESQFERTGEPVELSTFAGQTLFRTVQESLTNAQKHGKGVKHILVKLEYTPEAVRLLVCDDGQPPDAASTGQAGYGLQGLRERIDQLGGEFCCGRGASGGFEVDVRIPLQEGTRDPGPAG
jgi:signal transduction histidine kinase